MSEMSFEDMLNESFKTIRTGEVVTGKVIDVKPECILLNIGYKSDGIISRADYSADNSLDLTTVVKVGDELEAKVRKVNDGEGLVVLSHRDILTEKNNQKIQEAFENKEVLTGTVEKAVSGGLSVIYDGVKLFVPASLISDTFERDLTKYVGQNIEFIITEFNPMKRRIIGDRKKIIVERKSAAKKALLESIKEGDVIDGTVKNVTDFGAFVNLEQGIDALLHVSQISTDRIEKPSDVLKVGDVVKAKVTDLDAENKKISLSIKALLNEGKKEKEADGEVVDAYTDEADAAEEE